MVDDLSGATDDEPVGTVAEEAVKLFRALAVDAFVSSSAGTTREQAQEDPGHHECPNGWCPVCRMVTFVQENPEAVEALTASAITFARSLKDVLDGLITAAETDRESTEDEE